MKKIYLILIMIFALFSPVFGQSENTVRMTKGISKFLKGNISDKTTAVKEATNEDAEWLSCKAIEFALENKQMLGTDRELDGLAVAAILSISPDYVKNLTELQKTSLETNLTKLFSEFTDSSTVQIAVLNKFSSLKEFLSIKSFVEVMNGYIMSHTIQEIDSSVFKSSLSAFETIGNSETFIILNNFLNNPKYEIYHPQIERTISQLIPSCMNETLALIQTANLPQIIKIYSLVQKNSKISKNNLCEISEKVLSKSILLVDSTSDLSSENIEIQISALKILTENKWTRASTVTVSYFHLAKIMYSNGILPENHFVTTITSLSSVAPIDSVSPLTVYLEELNSQKERSYSVSTEVVLSVIKTLGAIGDKSAFDSLLAVTYLNYDESVLTAAREALSGLRW